MEAIYYLLYSFLEKDKIIMECNFRKQYYVY